MTAQEHPTPMRPNEARLLTTGKILVMVGTHMHVLTWDEAHALATAITDALQLEARP